MGMILSVFSLFMNETPRVSLRAQQPHQTDGSSESRRTEEDKWLPYINKEYENCNSDDVLTPPLPEFTRQRLTGYHRLGDVSFELVSYRESIYKSFRATLSITIAIAPITAFMMALLYMHLKTHDLCIEWQYHNHSLPLPVKRLRLIGNGVEVIITGLWFPLTAVVLFGWKVFKMKYISTFYVCVILG